MPTLQMGIPRHSLHVSLAQVAVPGVELGYEHRPSAPEPGLSTTIREEPHHMRALSPP